MRRALVLSARRDGPVPSTLYIECDACGSETRCPDPTDLPAGWAASLTGSAIMHLCHECALPRQCQNPQPEDARRTHRMRHAHGHH